MAFQNFSKTHKLLKKQQQQKLKIKCHVRRHKMKKTKIKQIKDKIKIY